MPDSKLTTEAGEKPVTFENWADDGTHVFVGHKHLLTLATPESSKCDEAYRAFIEDWISPEEYCTHLASILRALGASPAVLAGVEHERKNYLDHPIEPPTRSDQELLREVMAMGA